LLHGNQFSNIRSKTLLVVEPAVAELVEASKPPPSLALSFGRFDKLNDRSLPILKIDFREYCYFGA